LQPRTGGHRTFPRHFSPVIPADECRPSPTVLGLGIHEFACNSAVSLTETRGWQGQALP
jgi:hypothetical protein